MKCRLAILEKMKVQKIMKDKISLLLTDLCKVFDCHSHELVFVKLHAYGFRFAALRFLHNILEIETRE